MARRIQALQSEHDALPEQIRQARDSYQGAQAIVAEIELQEQLPAFIGVIARAAVARQRAGFTREQGRYEIEIPWRPWRRPVPRWRPIFRPAERGFTLASARHSAFIDLSQPQE